MVRTHIFAYKKAGNKPRRPDSSVSSPSKIADRLLDILKNTRENIDFLDQAVSKKFDTEPETKKKNSTCTELIFLHSQAIWGLCLLELYFLAVYEKKAVDAMTDCVLQKVNLVEIIPATNGRPGDIDLAQLKFVEYMLVQIHILLKNGRSMNVRELIVALYTVRIW